MIEYKDKDYEVIVIGGGHAGIEAALAAARLGKETAMFVMNLDSVANMPCNPSIGGTSKGHLVREIDALGGQMGISADTCFIQSKMLNVSKGPAVHSLRAQIDRKKYNMYMKNVLENQEHLDVIQSEVIEIIADNKQITGVKTKTGAIFGTKTVVVATGTYLKGKVIIGEVSYESGPDGVFPANELSNSLINLGIELRRFKTGTPARINIKTLDLSKMEVQKGDSEVTPFSFSNEDNEELQKVEQIDCYLTYTNEDTHKEIMDNIDRSPLFNGSIESVGPRYCPSIEDKVMRFRDKERHQIFIEPMGKDTGEMYIQGMSSSLPEEIQKKLYKTVEGMEDCRFMRSAYAIEYDAIDSTNLTLGLKYKDYTGLYFAGQINGSSGYEEAAAQGLIAGINAARSLENLPEFTLDRSEAYIGVLIDDLVTKGTNEPYRMMTSRAEYRLMLRQDNADLRLTEKGYDIGLISEERFSKYLAKKESIKNELERIKTVKVKADDKTNDILRANGSQEITRGTNLNELLKRTELSYEILAPLDEERPELSKAVKEQVDIQIKYEGYIKLQQEQINRFKKLEEKKIPEDLEYNKISGLSLEARQKLTKQQPINVGQASRISGVSPADISVLLIAITQFLKSNKKG
ncbi:MAG: tRNA uridine-5-carboxymethylaminomethyl(34) synthesis enzyme MnmG [Clostridia bacterium]|nr:tRNA uridine-5-carboxymethylaminomethyl(34) synthesis enzyme MnmG [Clostridia bacterium]